MKPGKPLAFGEVFRGDGSSAWFIGLPGNPVSSFVTFLLAVRPVLLRLQGASELAPRPIAMRADFAWPKPDRRREFLRVRRNDAGGLDLFGHQGSAVLTSTIWGDGLVDNPAGQAIAPGDTVRYLSLRGAARMKVAVRYFAAVREALGPGEDGRGRRRRRHRRAARRARRPRRPPRRGAGPRARAAQRPEPRPLRREHAARRRRRGRLLPAAHRRLKRARWPTPASRSGPTISTSAPKSPRCAPATAASARSPPSSARCATATTARRVAVARARALPGMTEAAIEAMIDEATAPLRDPRRARRPPHRRAGAGGADRPRRRHLGAPRRGVPGLRVPDGLPEDAGAVLEEGGGAGGRALGRRPRRRRRRPGALGHRRRQRRAPTGTGAPPAMSVERALARDRRRLGGRRRRRAPALVAGIWLNARWAGFPLGTLFVNCVGGLAHRRRPVLARALAERAAAPAPRHRPARRLHDLLGVLGRVADHAAARRAESSPSATRWPTCSARWPARRSASASPSWLLRCAEAGARPPAGLENAPVAPNFCAIRRNPAMRIDKLTTTFQEALGDAQSLAVARDNPYIEPAHVLAAMLAQADGPKALLARAGVNVAKLQAALDDAMQAPAAGAGRRAGASPGASSTRLLQAAEKEASKRGDQFISSEMFVLAAAESKTAIGALLKEFGATRKSLEAAIDAVRGGQKVDSAEAEGQREALKKYTMDLTERARARQARSGDRPRRRDPARDPGAAAADQEQPGADRRARRRQDGDRRGPGAAHRRRRGARFAQGQARPRPRHGAAARRREVPRRVRGAAEERAEGSRPGRRPDDRLHRRAPHHGRRRQGRRRDRRRQHAQARAGARRAALHRRDHARRIPQVHREGRRARAALPEDPGRRAERRGDDRDPARPAGEVRGAPRRRDHRPGDRRRGRALAPLHHRPLPARQGDRPDRRGGVEGQDRDRLQARGDRQARPPPDPAADRARRGASRRRTRRASAGAS